MLFLLSYAALSAARTDFSRGHQWHGGPILKNRFFIFTIYEGQRFTIGVNQPATEPSAVYQTAATAILNAHNVPVNQTSYKLLHGSGSNQGLWTTIALTRSATPFNYTNPENEFGFSHNWLVKLDYSINDNNKLSFKWHMGQGTLVAPTVSLLTPYYESALIYVQNYSLTHNTVLTSRLSNQIFIGVNYFNQAFSDFSTASNSISLGLDTGATGAALAGAPRIQIAAPSSGSGLGASSDGFDAVGDTPNSGRNDITGHRFSSADGSSTRCSAFMEVRHSPFTPAAVAACRARQSHARHQSKLRHLQERAGQRIDGLLRELDLNRLYALTERPGRQQRA